MNMMKGCFHQPPAAVLGCDYIDNHLLGFHSLGLMPRHPCDHHEYGLLPDLASPLPRGWEQCLDLKSGVIFFKNWITGYKTFADPRRLNHSNTDNEKHPSSNEALISDAALGTSPLAVCTDVIHEHHWHHHYRTHVQQPDHLNPDGFKSGKADCDDIELEPLIDLDLRLSLKSISSPQCDRHHSGSTTSISSTLTSSLVPSYSHPDGQVTNAASAADVADGGLLQIDLNPTLTKCSFTSSSSSSPSIMSFQGENEENESELSMEVTSLQKSQIGHARQILAGIQANASRNNYCTSTLYAVKESHEVTDMIKEQSNIIYESDHDNANDETMITVGCLRCLMYVLLSNRDPRCPQCGSDNLSLLNFPSVTSPHDQR